MTVRSDELNSKQKHLKLSDGVVGVRIPQQLYNELYNTVPQKLRVSYIRKWIEEGMSRDLKIVLKT